MRLIHAPPLLLCLLGSACSSDPGAPADPELAAYVELIGQAEQGFDDSPQRTLAMLRQLYYGESWSASSTDILWRVVIPCSSGIGDPRQRIGEALFDALSSKAETGGVDFGHVFAGLEAMACPSPKVTIVEMPNEEFATWGGDLGAAVAARGACARLGAKADKTPDCGSTSAGRSLEFYLGVHAPEQDLIGDFDPFVLRAVLLGVSCAESLLEPLALDRSLAGILREYYLDAGSALGQARAGRGECMLRALGATLDGGKISNRAAVVDAIAARLSSFAGLYFTKIAGLSPDADDTGAIESDARAAAEWLLTWLAAGVASP